MTTHAGAVVEAATVKAATVKAAAAFCPKRLLDISELKIMI